MQNASTFKSDFTLHTQRFEVRRNTAPCPHSVLYFVIICKELICGKTQDKKILNQGISHTVGMN